MKLKKVPYGCYYNTKIKIYRDGHTKTSYCSHSIFHYKEDELEEDHAGDGPLVDEEVTEDTPEEEEAKRKRQEYDFFYGNFRRMQENIFDLVYMNPWDYFLTITIDPQNMDSKDPRIVMDKLNVWLRNRVYRQGLQYLLIPERHDKGGIHCHALINDVLPLVDSGTVSVPGHKKPVKFATAQREKIPVDAWHPVYNCTDWKYGFSTAIPVYGEPAQLAVYITKYVTKENDRIFGRYYWSSRNLVRKPEIILGNTDFTALDLQVYQNQAAGISLKYDTDITFERGAIDDYETTFGRVPKELHDAEITGNHDFRV